MNQSQLVGGVLDLAVVAALATEESHGYELVRRLRDADFPPISDASVYGTLKRLEEWRLLHARLVESPDGRARRSYTVTEEGRAWLRNSVEGWRQLTTSIQRLLGEEAPVA